MHDHENGCSSELKSTKTNLLAIASLRQVPEQYVDVDASTVTVDTSIVTANEHDHKLSMAGA